MTKLPKKDQLEIELVPDAWPRFERFIREVVKPTSKKRTPKAAVKKRRPRKSA